MSWNFRNNRKALFLSSVLLVFIISSIYRFLALAQTPYANGWDGYYYVMQAHSWINYGKLQSVDFSLIYPYFSVLSYLIGDYEMAYKVGTSLLGATMVATTMSLIYAVKKNLSFSILAGAFLLFSPTITFFIVQFPKNVLGITLLNIFLLSIQSKHYRSSIFFFFIALFTHRMAAGICVLSTLLFFAKLQHKKWFLGGVVLMIIISFLPGIIHYTDVYRFENELNWMPQFAPYSFYTLLKSSISNWWISELAMLSISLFYILYNKIKDLQAQESSFIVTRVLPMIIVLSIFPFFNIGFGSMGYRFFMISPIFIVSLFATELTIKPKTSYFLAIILIIAGMFSFKSYNPIYHDPPNKLYEVIINRLESNYSASNYPLVIAHKSLAELIIYRTRFDALNWVPENAFHPSKTLRVINNLEFYHFKKHLSKSELVHFKKLTSHYYCTPEDKWKSFIQKVEDKQDSVLMNLIISGHNPLIPRPDYLSKGKDL